MLRQRVITAVVLLAVLLLSLWTPSPWPFALLTLAMISAAAWEWARLNAAPAAAALGCGAGIAVFGVVVAIAAQPLSEHAVMWQLATAAWAIGGAWALRGGPAGWARWPSVAKVVVGLLLLAVGWWALAQARIVGVNYLLSVLCVVWIADIAAYFGGRAFGRCKLAPTISPGKSWEGVVSGMFGVTVLAVFWVWLDARVSTDSASLFTQLRQRFGMPSMLLSVLALAGLSVVGDLFESLVKRAVGAKDSSGLLPGHGGVLDRIDALLPVLPAALALTTW